MGESDIYVIETILAVYSMVLLTCGTIANIFSFTICLRKRLRQIPTFVFLACMLLCDTVSLFFWNLDHFLMVFYGTMIEFLNIHTCRFSTFMQLFSLQSSAWLLVAMSIDRFLSVKFTQWRTAILHSKQALIAALIIIFSIFCINIHLTVTISYDGMENDTSPAKCFSTSMFLQWKQVHTYLYSIVPFVILGIVNSFLIQHTISTHGSLISRTSEDKAKRRTASYSITAMTVAFIMLTLPNAIAGGYYIAVLFSTRIGTMILFITDCLAFSFHSFNFVVFLISNKRFNEEFRSMISSIKPKNKVTIMLHTTKDTNGHS